MWGQSVMMEDKVVSHITGDVTIPRDGEGTGCHLRDGGGVLELPWDSIELGEAISCKLMGGLASSSEDLVSSRHGAGAAGNSRN